MNAYARYISIEFPYERAVSRALFLMLGVLFFAYLYLVGASVLNIIARKEAVRTGADIQSSIALMEREFFALSEAITPDVGSSLGLAPVDETVFIYRPGSTAVDNVGREADTMRTTAL